MNRELAKLTDEIDAIVKRGNYVRLDPHEAGAIVAALRRLAAQDHKPVAYVPISQSPDDRGQPIWRETRPHGSQNPWTGYECKDLYLSPPPAAGWDEALEAAESEINDGLDVHRWIKAWESDGRKIDEAVAIGFYHQALQDARKAIEALRHNAPPDSGAGKDQPCKYIGPCGWKSDVQDHGGADAGVKLAEWNDPQVQLVYKILCDNTEQPENEHWEGFAARRIIAALSKVAANASAEARLREDAKPRKVVTLQDCTCDKCDGTGRYEDESCPQCLGEGSYEEPIVVECVTADALSAHPHASDSAKSDGAIYAEVSRRETPPEEQAALDAAVDEALSHASDCDKQGTTTFIPVQDAEPANVAGRTGGAHPPTGANPSDRTADVTVEELADFLRNKTLYTTEYEDDARALLDAFKVGRR